MQIIRLERMTQSAVEECASGGIKLPWSVLALGVSQSFTPEQEFPAGLAFSAGDHVEDTIHQIQVRRLQI